MNELKQAYQYIYFAALTDKIWQCFNRKSDACLGSVEWYGRWRQWVFHPYEDTIFSAGCLADIQDFIQQLSAKGKP